MPFGSGDTCRRPGFPAHRSGSYANWEAARRDRTPALDFRCSGAARTRTLHTRAAARSQPAAPVGSTGRGKPAMRMMGPADQAMIARAVAHARAAGVPEERIQQVIEQQGAGRAGALVPAALAGQLNALARQFERPQSPPAE